MKYTLRVDNLVRKINRMKLSGLLRFKIVRWIYDTFEVSNPRKGEWDFVLKYLPDVRHLYYPAKIGPLLVLDVGASESLLVHELRGRGYNAYGLDQRDPQDKIPYFFKRDITEHVDYFRFEFSCFPHVPPIFNYIVAVSSIEHVGLGAFGDVAKPNGDRLALETIHRLLIDEGFFIMTVPMAHWRCETARGYSLLDIRNLIEGLFEIFEITQANGQLCMALCKKSKRIENEA